MNQPRTDDETLREAVRDYYATIARGAASCSFPSASCCDPAVAAPESSRASSTARADGSDVFGAGLYAADDLAGLPAATAMASAGCANPVALADLAPGEVVLDLGSGGGIDVLLAARRVGPTGFAYGVDMTDEMLELARANAAEAEDANVEFLEGDIAAVPLADEAVDVVVSNCVVNLAVDKQPVFAEAWRVLRAGGRLAVADVVADDGIERSAASDTTAWASCSIGALTRGEYSAGLTAAGFAEITITDSHEVAPGYSSAFVRAVKPF